MRTIRVAVAGIFLVLGVAHAQPPVLGPNATSMPRYPWDQRPTKCFAPDAPPFGDCKLENWPSFGLTSRRLAILYYNGQFALLERALAEVATPERRFASGESGDLAIYEAFRQVLNGGNVDPEAWQRQIAQWRAVAPNSRYTYFAEARFYYAHAWAARGSGYASSVSKESWQLFNIRLQQSEQMLLQAPVYLKESPLWHNLLLAVASDTRNVRSDPDEVFERAIKRWPSYYNFYAVRLTRMFPQWGGSWDEIEAFIRQWSKAQEATEGRSLYARLYIAVLGMGYTPDETHYDWGLMKESLNDLVKRFPDPIYRNLNASFACVARDDAAFRKAIGAIPSHEVIPGAWIRGHSPEACMRWAGT